MAAIKPQKLILWSRAGVIETVVKVITQNLHGSSAAMVKAISLHPQLWMIAIRVSDSEMLIKQLVRNDVVTAEPAGHPVVTPVVALRTVERVKPQKPQIGPPGGKKAVGESYEWKAENGLLEAINKQQDDLVRYFTDLNGKKRGAVTSARIDLAEAWGISSDMVKQCTTGDLKKLVEDRAKAAAAA